MIRTIAVVFIAFLMTATLSACGKKGDPKPPDQNSTYPQKYPKAR